MIDEDLIDKIIENNGLKTNTEFSLDKDGNLICQIQLTEEEMNKLCLDGYPSTFTVSTQFLTE